MVMASAPFGLGWLRRRDSRQFFGFLYWSCATGKLVGHRQRQIVERETDSDNRGRKEISTYLRMGCAERRECECLECNADRGHRAIRTIMVPRDNEGAGIDD